MKIKEWRPVVGFEGGYEVSNLGRVRSLDRFLPRIGNSPRIYRGKILNPQAKKAGHLWVQLGRGNQFYVHHLVLEAFVGPCPAGQVGLHWDDEPSNNFLENLRWGTRSDNYADYVRNYGRHPGRPFVEGGLR